MNVSVNPEQTAAQLQRLRALLPQVDPDLRPVLFATCEVIRLVQLRGAPRNTIYRAIPDAPPPDCWAVSRGIIDGQAAVCIMFSSDPRGYDLRRLAMATALATDTPEANERNIAILLGTG